MSASKWTRLLTGVVAGTARLSGAVGSALRPAIQRLGESAPASFRPASSALVPARLRFDLSGRLPPASSLLRPASDAVTRVLRPASDAFGPASDAVMRVLRPASDAFGPASDAVMRAVRAELAAFRTSPGLHVDAVDEGRALGEESWGRVVFPALRRLGKRWKPVTDVLADYKRLKDLYQKIATKLKRKEPKPRPQPQPASPVPEPAAEESPTPPSATRRSTILGDSPVDGSGWAIISRVAIVSGPGEGVITEDADFVIDWRIPLAVSMIMARRTEFVCPAPVAPGRDDFAYVVAVDDDAAVFLLRALPHHDSGRSYMLCNGATGEASPLPREFAHMLLKVGNLGLACSGQLVVVVELQPLPGGGAILQRFHQWSDQEWRHDPVTVGYPLGDRPWGGHGVVTHSGHVFFVDLGQGLLMCDPLVEKPEMTFMALPAEGCGTVALDTDDISKTRCVTVSDGCLLYVQMDMDGGVLLRTWSLDMEGAPGWTPRRQVQFSSTLFRSPVLLLVHPRNTDLVCLCDVSMVPWMFGIDMGSEGIVDAQPLAVPGVPSTMLSSSMFHGLA